MKPLKFIRHLLVALLLAQGLLLEAQHYVPIGGEVDSLLTLPRLGGDSAYLVNESLTVTDGGDLRVEAGTKIYFGQSAYLRVDGGRLWLDGQRNDSIYLLCYEFSHDWVGVQLKNVYEEDAVRLSYVEVVGALTALNASTSSHVSVSHCTFSNFYAGKGIELIDCCNFLIDSCFFSQCVSGIELKSRANDSKFNRFSHNIFDQGQINIEISNVGYGYKCDRNYISDNCFQGAATAISFETVGGISDKDAKNFIENNLISSDLPEGGSGYSSYGIKTAMDSLVIRNNVFWSNDEAIRMMRVCQLTVERNTFYDNDLTITNIHESGSVNCVDNTISEAKKRIINFPSNLSRMNGNNFLHYKKNAILFANVTTDDIDMRANYWDAETTQEIDMVILDKKDTPTLGEIIYEGYLPECNTAAPISPPFAVKKQFVNGSWLISWEDNPERDIDHYALFYGDFNYYKFAHCIDSIFGNSYTLSSQQADNVAVMACDGAYNPEVYASTGQSAYAFADYYPYAGADGELCAPQQGFIIESANVPYIYGGFVWHTSGTGLFSDSLSMRPVYYPSEEDFEAGEVTLTLRVTFDGVTKSDALQLRLYKELGVFAGEDYYGGLTRPLSLDQAVAYNYDSLMWHTLGDGVFEDSLALHTLYYPGETDRERGFVNLVLEAWSYCGYASDTVHFDLYKEFSLEGRTWSGGELWPNTQVLAASLNNENQFLSGFYRTVSDETGAFKFASLLPDTYILYAFPDTVEMRSGGTYYLGDLQWSESNMIVVDGDVFDVDIDLPILTQGLGMGEGIIGGIFDYPETSFKAREFYCQPWLRDGEDVAYCSDGLSNVGVLLLNSNKQRILGFALTDYAGRFRFGYLPFGTYQVMADLPRYGRGMCEEITLSPEQPSLNDLHLFVNQDGRVSARYQSQENVSAELSVYPNPADDMITVGGLKSHTDYRVAVMNSFGIVVLADAQARTDLLGELSLSVSELPSGFYFIRMENANGGLTAKFVKH